MTPSREAFRARLKRLRLEAFEMHVADGELGAFFGLLTPEQAERIVSEHLWWLEGLKRAEILAAFFGEPLQLEERRRLMHEDIAQDRRETLDAIVAGALKQVFGKEGTK
jgi:hypothetical protein